MNKQTQIELVPAAPPPAQSPLQEIVASSGLDATKAKYILEQFQNYFELASEWELKAKRIVVTNASQTADMNMARAGRLFLRQKRLDVENSRKALKEQSLREGKAIDGIANVLKALIVPIEEHLERQEFFVEIQEAKKAEAERIAAEKKEEEDRIAAEKAAAEEAERNRIDNERLRKEATEREKQMAAERTLARQQQERQAAELLAQQQAAEKERKRQTEELRKQQEEAQRRQLQERQKAQAERDRIQKEADEKLVAERRKAAENLEAERKAREKAEAELRAKREAEAKAAAEEETRQEEEAKASDAQKLRNLAQHIDDMMANIPSVKSKSAKSKIQRVKTHLEDAGKILDG